MITGKITTNEEPAYRSGSLYDDDDYEGYGGVYGGYGYQYHRVGDPNYKTPYQRREEQWQQLKAQFELMGFKQGVRVIRSTGAGAIGTVVRVADTCYQAYNFQTGTFEPFKVQWDDSSEIKPDALFDYSADEIQLYKEEAANDQNVSYIPFAC